MAEVQTTTESGEMAQRFIEFLMMQQQNAALFLGLIPNPQTGKGEVNLEVAKMFIDQLVMIRVKTRGNLSEDELKVLNNAISNLQMAFVEISQRQGQPETEPEEIAPPVAETPASVQDASGTPAETDPESASKKKFTKSYGA
jgi:hypothetical protein